MPRVGSNSSSVCTPFAIQRAIVTFCWLPPDSRRTSPCARVSICNRSMAGADPRGLVPHRDRAPCCDARQQRQRDIFAHRTRHEQRMRPVAGDQRQASGNCIGRMVERHRACHRPRPCPPMARRLPARTSNNSSCPWPSSATTPRTSPWCRSSDTSDKPRPGRQPAHPQGAGWPVHHGLARMSSCSRVTAPPSIISTIRSSIPGSIARSPTVDPSRSTVARSQIAAISVKRCEI